MNPLYTGKSTGDSLIRYKIKPLFAHPISGVDAGHVNGLATHNSSTPVPPDGIQVRQRLILGADGFVTHMRDFVVPGRGIVSTAKRFNTARRGSFVPIRAYVATEV